MTAAAARASRQKRWRATSLWASLRVDHLDGHVAVQARVVGVQDDAHAAAADDPQHAEGAELAERSGSSVGWRKSRLVIHDARMRIGRTIEEGAVRRTSSSAA